MQPQISVYSFATPADQKPPTTVRDLAGEGQAAYIKEISAAKDAGAWRKLIGAPFAGKSGALSAAEAPSLDRTMVISVAKPNAVPVGDRLMRTVISITPHQGSFEFAGYTVAATDNQVQNIAHLETSTEVSLDASAAPPFTALGDTSLAAKLSRSQSSAADIAAQYEKLNIDFAPRRIVITRESERGTDVMGNTIIKLSIVPTLPPGMPAPETAYLVVNQNLFKDGNPLPAKDAVVDLDEVGIPLRCDIFADVGADYQIRHVVRGTEYYTEGKQVAQIVRGNTGSAPQLLVRAAETQEPYWQITENGGAVLATSPGQVSHRLLFNNFAAAESFAAWLSQSSAAGVGTDGVKFLLGGRRAAGRPVHAQRYSFACSK